MQFPVAVPGLDRDDVAVWIFLDFWNFSVGCEWDRDPELESDFGFQQPGIVGHGRAYGDGAG